MPATGASGGAAPPRRTLPEFFGLVTEKIQRRLRELEERAATPPASHPTKPPLVRTDTWAAERAAAAAAACSADVAGDEMSDVVTSGIAIKRDVPTSAAYDGEVKDKACEDQA